MIRALSVHVQRVRAEGRTLHVGGQTAIAEARLVGPDDKLYAHATTCLLYTSDAADERSSVDLGGRRIIKKKKQDIDKGCTSNNKTRTNTQC